MAINGIGSSFDVASLVRQMMAIERQPLARLDSREKAVKDEQSAWTTLRSRVSALESAIGAMARPGAYSPYAGALSDASIAAVTVDSTASAGSYSLEVIDLAYSHKLVAAQVASSSTVVGSGRITIEFGRYGAGAFEVNPDKASFTVDIAAGSDSLQAIRNAINAANKGVSANIVNDGTGAQLVLTSVDTGEVNALKITVADDDGNDTDANGLSKLAYDPAAPGGAVTNLSQLVAAANARFKIDGVEVVSASNQVSTAIQGITLSLAKETAAPVTLAVARDYAKVLDTVDAFVKAYNDLNKQVRDLTFYDAASKTAGKLQGESAVTSMQRRLRSELGEDSGHVGAKYRTLSDLGVAMQSDGSLKLDRSKLEAALKTDASSVIEVFVGPGTDPALNLASKNGVAGELNELLHQMLSSDGLFGGRSEALANRLEVLGDERERFERRMELIEKRYRQQFEGLDRLLAGFSQMGTFLSRL